MKIARYLLFALLILGGQALAADPGQLIGTWRFARHPPAVRVVTFNADHSFVLTVTIDGKPYGTATGRWQLQGEVLKYQYARTNFPGVPNDATDEDTILGVTADTLVLSGADGYGRQYERIGK
jgi:hypothetical protein